MQDKRNVKKIETLMAERQLVFQFRRKYITVT